MWTFVFFSFQHNLMLNVVSGKQQHTILSEQTAIIILKKAGFSYYRRFLSDCFKLSDAKILKNIENGSHRQIQASKAD